MEGKSLKKVSYETEKRQQKRLIRFLMKQTIAKPFNSSEEKGFFNLDLNTMKISFLSGESILFKSYPKKKTRTKSNQMDIT